MTLISILNNSAVSITDRVRLTLTEFQGISRGYARLRYRTIRLASDPDADVDAFDSPDGEGDNRLVRPFAPRLSRQQNVRDGAELFMILRDRLGASTAAPRAEPVSAPLCFTDSMAGAFAGAAGNQAAPANETPDEDAYAVRLDEMIRSLRENEELFNVVERITSCFEKMHRPYILPEDGMTDREMHRLNTHLTLLKEAVAVVQGEDVVLQAHNPDTHPRSIQNLRVERLPISALIAEVETLSDFQRLLLLGLVRSVTDIGLMRRCNEASFIACMESLTGKRSVTAAVLCVKDLIRVEKERALSVRGMRETRWSRMKGREILTVIERDPSYRAALKEFRNRLGFLYNTDLASPLATPLKILAHFATRRPELRGTPAARVFEEIFETEGKVSDINSGRVLL